MTALLWLRRDLRVHDHPALQSALQSSDRLVAVFCLDDRLLHGRHASGPRTQFMLECLADLDGSLRSRGARLVVRFGPPERELPALARAVEARSLHFTADAGPFARRRDARVVRAFSRDRLAVFATPGAFVIDDVDAVRTSAGTPYAVFTPFHRAWLSQPRREPLGLPRSLPALPDGLDPGRLPGLSELGLEQEVCDPPLGGETRARALMRSFLKGPVKRYGERRNELAGDGASRLSPYLHFGCLSPRELEALLPAGPGAEEYRRQLCWRDFYAHVLAGFPSDARSEHQARLRGSLSWSHARKRFAAWCEGRTGFPLVDAAMRQLRHEGWMPNRARLVAASFLTKDLWIDWRWGERWFMRLLVDGDEASNNGNWQWIASVGVDPQPASRRILNPTRQQKRFDPGGAYVRRYVPELAAVPDHYLADPWRMPAALQREIGCVLGRDYPEPIVDHSAARSEALARFGAPVRTP
jgi:deoxyribodipyrimidine photo-lyase